MHILLDTMQLLVCTYLVVMLWNRFELGCRSMLFPIDMRCLAGFTTDESHTRVGWGFNYHITGNCESLGHRSFYEPFGYISDGSGPEDYDNDQVGWP